MEHNIYDLIIETFKEGMRIPLIRDGRFYIYIGVTATRINNIHFEYAISYKISKQNSKRITRQFIELTYQYFLEHGDYPNREWYANNPELNLEFKSRPCNKSVARGLIERVK